MMSRRFLTVCSYGLGLVCLWTGPAYADGAEEAAMAPPAIEPILEPDTAELSPEVSGDDLQAEPEEPLSELAQRISAFEHDQAKVILQARVREIERASHRYDADLIEPLTLLGDANMQAGAFEDALDNYNRAVHIDRVTNGLHTPGQLEVVYKEAGAWVAIGNLVEANNRYEYAYEVQRRRYPNNDLELLEPTYRLADWYVSHYNILPARTLYIRAIGILDHHGMGEHPDAIEPLRKLADTYRLQRFPPIYMRRSSEKSDNTFSLSGGERSSTDIEATEAAALTISQFPRGEKALNRVVRILQADPNTPPLKLAEAYVELGDWNLMFGYPRRAQPLYARAYELVAESGADPATHFAEPALLYFPTPPALKQPRDTEDGEAQEGFVKVSFTVNRSGEIQKLTTVEAVPDERMVFRVRRSMRLARYRPALDDSGTMVEFPGLEYVHTYDHWTDGDAVAAAEPIDDTADAESAPQTAPPIEPVAEVQDG